MEIFFSSIDRFSRRNPLWHELMEVTLASGGAGALVCKDGCWAPVQQSSVRPPFVTAVFLSSNHLLPSLVFSHVVERILTQRLENLP